MRKGELKMKFGIIALLITFSSLFSQKGYSTGNTVTNFDMDILWPDGTTNKTSVYELIDQNKVIVLFFGSPG